MSYGIMLSIPLVFQIFKLSLLRYGVQMQRKSRFTMKMKDISFDISDLITLSKLNSNCLMKVNFKLLKASLMNSNNSYVCTKSF